VAASTRIIRLRYATGIDHFLRFFDFPPDAIFTEAARDDLSFDEALDEPAAFLELLDDGAVLDDAVPVLEEGAVFDDLDDGGAVFEADLVAATGDFCSGFSFVSSAPVFATHKKHG